MQETLGGFYYIIFGGLGLLIPFLFYIAIKDLFESIADSNIYTIIVVAICVLVAGYFAYLEKSILAIVILVVVPIIGYFLATMALTIIIFFVAPYYTLMYGFNFFSASAHMIQTMQWGFVLYVILFITITKVMSDSEFEYAKREYEENRIIDKIAARFKKDEK